MNVWVYIAVVNANNPQWMVTVAITNCNILGYQLQFWEIDRVRECQVHLGLEGLYVFRHRMSRMEVYEIVKLSWKGCNFCAWKYTKVWMGVMRVMHWISTWMWVFPDMSAMDLTCREMEKECSLMSLFLQVFTNFGCLHEPSRFFLPHARRYCLGQLLY